MLRNPPLPSGYGERDNGATWRRGAPGDSVDP
jgi:hypothetical protein